MPAYHPLEAKLARSWPPAAWQDVTVLLAVSGGADSVAMLRAVATLKTGGPGRLCAAHFDHRLRGRESADDETFVVALCRRLNIHCEVGRALKDQLAANSADGLEAAARTARYEFLQQTAARLGARYVATAHSADDQAETILHRILRGTGIAGLSGMTRTRSLGEAATLIRPLLGFRRAELVAYLDELRQPYRQDSSNFDTRLTRNRIRHELLPTLARQFNPAVAEALLRLGSLAGEVQGVVEGIVADLVEQCVVDVRPDAVQIDAVQIDAVQIDAVRIDAVRLASQPRYVVRELIIAVWRRQHWPMQSMGFSQWDRLAEMVTACAEHSGPVSQCQTFPGDVTARAEPGCLRLGRSPSKGRSGDQG